MSISIDQIMNRVHEYGERGSVEADLESVLVYLHVNHPSVYTEIADHLTDTEMSVGMADVSSYQDSLLDDQRYKAVLTYVQTNYDLIDAVQEFLDWDDDMAEDADGTDWNSVVEEILTNSRWEVILEDALCEVQHHYR